MKIVLLFLLCFTTNILGQELFRGISFNEDCVSITIKEESLGSKKLSSPQTEKLGLYAFDATYKGAKAHIQYRCTSTHWRQSIEYGEYSFENAEKEFYLIASDIQKIYGKPTQSYNNISVLEKIYMYIFQNDMYQELKYTILWEIENQSIFLRLDEKLFTGNLDPTVYAITLMNSSPVTVMECNNSNCKERNFRDLR